MVMTRIDLREYGKDNGGSPSSPDQKWIVEEEDCERFSELPVNRDDIRHIYRIYFGKICLNYSYYSFESIVKDEVLRLYIQPQMRSFYEI